MLVPPNDPVGLPPLMDVGDAVPLVRHALRSRANGAHFQPGQNVELHRKQDAIKNPLLLFERRVERVCVNRACTEYRTFESCYMRSHTAAPGQIIPCHHNRWNYCAECVRIGLMRGKCPRSELAPCGNVTVEPPLSDAAAERCADHIYNYTKGHYPFLPSIWARYHAESGPAPLEALLAAGANATAPKDDGFTPLLFACFRGHPGAARALLDHTPAAVLLSDVAGLSPLAAACIGDKP